MFVALIPPILTCIPKTKFDPVIVTVCPPVAGPEEGVIELIVGESIVILKGCKSDWSICHDVELRDFIFSSILVDVGFDKDARSFRGPQI